MPGLSSSARVVAILGTRYEDFQIEEAVLAPLGVLLRTGSGANAEEIVAVAAGAEVILTGSGSRLDADTISRLACRGIVRCGIGTESIDLEAARAAGMWVARVADYGTEAVAAHAIALALAGVRRLREADAHVRAGGWGFAELRPLHPPSALTAGVVGYGRIGRAAAHLLAGLGFTVLAHDPLVAIEGSSGIESSSLERLLGEADVVSLHAPGSPDGAPLLDAQALGRLKHGSVLVNTSRGSLVDPVALAAGLRAGRPRVAALDVFPHEPPGLEAFADVLDRMILTPHMAWYTEESEQDLRRKAAEEAKRLLQGERPLDVVVEPPPAKAASA